jgi:DNA-binding response OmpR family regulator
MGKILIIDDEANIRFLINNLLCQQHDILEAPDGEEGLELFQQQDPDLIILDSNIPEITGVELIRKIRAGGSKVKIIAISALLDLQVEKEKVVSAGADYCMAKPMDLANLKKIANDLISEKASIVTNIAT